jgi:hypothetical protein
VPAADRQPAIPPGGPRQLSPEERARREPWIEPLELEAASKRYGGMDLHTRNFVDCVKSRRQPNAGAEAGHRAATACHLANISLRLGGRRLIWDADKEEIVGDREAAAMLVRPYRAPWDRELASLRLGA